MTHVVAKPFKTANRRFAVGAEIAPNDVAGAVAFDVWVARGFITDKAPPAIAKSASNEEAPSRGARTK